MASPLDTTKQTVNLAPAGAARRVSRIRRNPPPAPAKEPVLDREDREKLSFTFGILAITLALAIAIVGVGAYAGSSPREYQLYFEM
jgi:hypothetical protein